jgi:nucleoside-diphosphate-sugar epimerase
MNKILLIGNRGYIGSYLQKKILENNHSVVGIDLCLFSDPDDHTIQMDYKNLTKDFLEKFQTVILLAAHSSVKMCENDIINSYNNNVTNFIELVEKLKDTNIKFIYASSSSVYGTCTEIADEEYNIFYPHNNYDITKYISDLYIQRTNVEYYGLRFGTVNGYSQLLRTDIMINAMYTSAIHDNEIKLYSKSIMRPILGIEDLCDAILTIVECEEDKRGIYNLASFNLTAEKIALNVGKILNVPVNEYDHSIYIQENNPKIKTICYDFKINCEKFINNFNFNFKETVESIVKSLSSNIYIETKRNIPFIYERI